MLVRDVPSCIPLCTSSEMCSKQAFYSINPSDVGFFMATQFELLFLVAEFYKQVRF